MRLFGIVKESITDGPGLRYAIFVQGCPHFCVGCHNQDSIPFEGGYETSKEEILEEILRNPLLDGITLSGGEPFMQAGDLAVIARGAKEKGLSVMTFSGYTFEELLDLARERTGYTELLSHTDILIDGKFEIDKKSMNLRFRGSSNQRSIDVQQSLKEGKTILITL